MKRYLVFKGDTYYPIGGWEDFAGDFDTLEEAKEKALTPPSDWRQVVDTKHGQEVWVNK